MTRTAEGPAPYRTGPTDEGVIDHEATRVEGSADARPVPLYRSAEWEALPTSDPRKSAAVWRAANCWVEYWSAQAVAVRLADELATIDAEVRRRIRATSYEVCTGADWRALAGEPTHAELDRLRGELPDGPCLFGCGRCSRCVRAAVVAQNAGDYPGAAGRNRGAA